MPMPLNILGNVPVIRTLPAAPLMSLSLILFNFKLISSAATDALSLMILTQITVGLLFLHQRGILFSYLERNLDMYRLVKQVPKLLRNQAINSFNALSKAIFVVRLSFNVVRAQSRDLAVCQSQATKIRAGILYIACRHFNSTTRCWARAILFILGRRA